MNKIVTSVGLLALGASALHAAESSTLNNMQDSKAWSVQATLRGFYDDNVTTVPSGSEIESAGFEVAPSIRFGMPGEQTSFNVGYGFRAMFYDKNLGGRSGKSDYTHTFDADFAHAFSPRLDVSLNESFVIGQEPDVIGDRAGKQRIDGDNIRNFAGIDFNIAVTDLLGFGIGYNNSFYDYDDEGAVFAGTAVAAASNSGLLDRMEHSVRIDSNWKLSPTTVGVIGYTYSQVGYTGDEAIAGNTVIPAGTLGGVVMSDFRDSQGHTIYLGAQHVFSPALSGYANVGGQYYTYINDPADEAQWSPYVRGGLTYALQATTSFDIGIDYSRTAANEAGSAGTQFVRDTETATVYATLKHEIISKLIGSVNGAYSDAKYNGGGATIDGAHQLYYRLGLDLSYEFARNISGHIGYNYDKIDSQLQGRDYDRNRVYAGVTAGF